MNATLKPSTLAHANKTPKEPQRKLPASHPIQLHSINRKLPILLRATKRVSETMSLELDIIVMIPRWVSCTIIWTLMSNCKLCNFSLVVIPTINLPCSVCLQFSLAAEQEEQCRDEKNHGEKTEDYTSLCSWA